MKARVYEVIAELVEAYKICEQRGFTHADWKMRHRQRVREFTTLNMPNGSGFDNGTTLDLENSSAERLVFDTAFQHLNDQGEYTRWSEHEVIVTASLAHQVTVRVTGRDHNAIKGTIAEKFVEALTEECDNPYKNPARITNPNVTAT